MRRLAGSSKFWAAVAAAIGATCSAGAAVVAVLGLEPERARDLAGAIMALGIAGAAAVTALGAVVVQAIGAEDAARLNAGGTPKPPPQ